MALRSAIFSLIMICLLAGCGSRADDPLLNTAQSLASGAFSRNAPEAPRVDPRAVLTRDLINRAAVPLILVENDTIGTSSTMTRIATNGPNETWQGDGDITITLSSEGLLRATRGYAFDLYSTDIEAARVALVQRRGGSAPRVHSAVEGDIQTVQTGYSCEIGFGGSEAINIFGRVQTLTRVIERCTLQLGNGAPFENRYWVDGDGFAWASEQYAGPQLGHFRIERLYR